MKSLPRPARPHRGPHPGTAAVVRARRTPFVLVSVLWVVASFWLGAPPAGAQPPPPAPTRGAAATVPNDPTAARLNRPLPPGWSTRRVAAGYALSYDAGQPIPVTDAGVRVVAGGRDLGPASVAGGVATVVVPRLPADLGSLALRSGGRPVDALLDAADTTTGVGAGSRAVPGPATAVVPPSLTPRAAEPVIAVDYLLPSLKDDRVTAPLRVLARVVAPRAPRADRPLVLFAHGRHGTCYRRGEVSGAYPCPKGWRSLPSLLGYEYAQRLIAGQGFVTVSIDLNGVNGQDDVLDDGGAGLRSTLIRHHLQTLTAWNAEPATVPFAKKLSLRFDPRSILLVGHSRGGEGVARAVAQAETDDPYAVAGLLLLAPTDFARQTVPNVPTTVILPSCDGDVSDLQGQLYVDRTLDAGNPTALHTAVYVPGSNHNFYNSEWTPSTARAPAFDDGEASGCVPRTRLNDRAVRSVGATYALATGFAYLARQERGTDLLDGTVGTPPGSAVRGLLATSVGGPRRLLWRGNAAGTPAATVTGGRLCHSMSDRADACASGVDLTGPHWLTADDRVPRSARLALARRGAEAGLRFTDPVDLDRSDWLDLRVVVAPGTAGRLSVRLEDTAGRSILVTPRVGASVHGLPAVLPRRGQPGTSGHLWGQLVRVAADPAWRVGVDLHHVRAIRLVSLGGGLDGAVLLDVSAGVAGLGDDATSPPLPRLDPVGASPTVPEGSVHRTVTVPFALNRPASSDVEIVAAVAGGQDDHDGTGGIPVLHRIPVAAGDTRVDVPVRIAGNRLDDPDRTYLIAVEINGQAITGGWVTTLTVRDDDPAPRLTITPAATTREGRTLAWVARLDRPSGQHATLEISATPSRRELSVADLPPSARAKWGVDGRPPGRPLSRAGLTSYSDIPPGKTSVVIGMGTLRDRRREGPERVTLRVVPGQVASTRPIVLTGTVSD